MCCPTCKGSGSLYNWFIGPNVSWRCYNCSGTGMVTTICPKCRYDVIRIDYTTDDAIRYVHRTTAGGKASQYCTVPNSRLTSYVTCAFFIGITVLVVSTLLLTLTK